MFWSPVDVLKEKQTSFFSKKEKKKIYRKGTRMSNSLDSDLTRQLVEPDLYLI